MHCGPPTQNFGWATRGLPYSAPCTRGLESAVHSPSGVWGPGRSPDRSRILLHSMLAKRVWLQHFGYLASIAMSGKMKANPGSGRIWYLLFCWQLTPYKYYIIVDQTGRLIFVGYKFAAP